ncbi:hypothetical protein BDY19DRAFT_988114 [Irpex rosettiformis]|uniref:Uncharacterized protein n=1 Tax=Irpex rosettiformis TaxID=378272 RepID=A0ACB8UIH6_9APHY|nr:hypothetical protein BDY19DRAFT_988114 [Irpex rosettiformis]
MAKPTASTPATSLSSRPHPPRLNLAHSSSLLSPRHVNIQATRPSSTVLAVLAAVAASSSTVDGRPLSTDSQPLDFLCPILASDNSDCASSSKATSHIPDVDPRLYYLSPTPTRNKRRPKAVGYVPDKFSKGEDGRWRRESTWSLYGSTHCECEDAIASATAVPQVDDQIDPSQITNQDQTTSQPTQSSNMTANLPPGWEGNSSKDVPAYILVLSIFLAILIFGTIFGCVGWRRKRRAFARMDYEKRIRKQMKEECDSDTESQEVRQARTQQKMWAKASAKWKIGIRMSIRRRRRRAVPQVIQDSEPRRSTDTLVSRMSEAPSTISPRSVGISGPAQTDNTPRLSSPSSRDGDLPHIPPASSVKQSIDSARPSHPPQYPEDSTSSTVQGQHPNVDRPSTLDLRRSSVVESAIDPPAPPSGDDIPYTASVGHVATDDKTVLARMVQFASAPPEDDDVAGPSVPEIEDLEQDAIDLLNEDPTRPSYSESSSHWNRSVLSNPCLAPSGLSSLLPHTPAPIYSREPSPPPDSRSPPPAFPPPPTKAQLFYEYPSTFEVDVEGTEPEPMPSAPPFEFASGPSAPPDDAFESQDLSAMACAPPLIDEEEETQLGLAMPPGSSSWPTVTASPVGEDRQHQDQVIVSHQSEHSNTSRPPTSFQSRSRAASPPGYLP